MASLKLIADIKIIEANFELGRKRNTGSRKDKNEKTFSQKFRKLLQVNKSNR